MEKILLVNDSIFENIIMRDMLESLGYEVETTNEFDAYLAMDNFKPNIVIANLIMKKITGDVLLNKMKKENPSLKTILSSSNNLKAQDLEGKAIDCFIQIPVKIEIMEKALSGINKEVHKFQLREVPKKENQPMVTTSNESRKINFCPECGSDLKNLNINSRFCAYCGCKL